MILWLVPWLAFFSRLPRRARLRRRRPAARRARAAAGVVPDSRRHRRPAARDRAALGSARGAARARAALVFSRGPFLEAATTAPAAPGASVVAAPAAAASATTVKPSIMKDLPEFPQFLGPTRDAALPGPRLARDWAARPPRRLWRQPLGQSWSGFAISGEIAVTQEQRGDEGRVVASTPQRPAALVARRPRALRDRDRRRRSPRHADDRGLACVRDGGHGDPERARARERESPVVARRRQGDGRPDPGLGPELLTASRGRPGRGDRRRLRRPSTRGLRRRERRSRVGRGRRKRELQLADADDARGPAADCGAECGERERPRPRDGRRAVGAVLPPGAAERRAAGASGSDRLLVSAGWRPARPTA